MPDPSIQLFLRADDFGITPGTNDAILAAVEAGVPLNIGVMAPGPSLRHRWNDLLAVQDRACVGVHVTANSEWAELRCGPILPAADVPTLVEADGTFHRSMSGRDQLVSVAEIRREAEAQLGLLRGAGLEPRYLDTHMPFVWIPGVRDTLEDLCEREGLIFADSEVYTLLRLPPDASASEIRSAIAASGGDRVFWRFHPAWEDEQSPRLYIKDPSPEVSRQRAREARILGDPAFLERLRSLGNIRPAFFDGRTL